MSTPIIFIHRGVSTYLHFSIRLAKRNNPDSRIYLICDVPPSEEWKELVHYIPLSHFASSLARFDKRYIHISHTEVAYEKFCFSRWLIINELVKEFGLTSFLHLDSDVLLFENADEGMKNFAPADFTLSYGHSGHTSFWRNTKALEQFCDYFLGFYNGTDDRLVKEVLDWFHTIIKSDVVNYGVSDMYFLTSFVKQHPQLMIGETTQIIGGTTYDNNMNIFEENNVLYQASPEKKKKQIFWTAGAPYGYREDTKEFIRFRSLHFQGETKFHLHEYFSCSIVSETNQLPPFISHEVICDEINKHLSQQ